MASIRSFVFAACAPALLLACGDSGGTITPEGTHYQYVVSKANVPTNNNQAREYGLDLGSAKSSKPDGTVDNQLGMVLGTLAGMGFDVQKTITDAVNQGSIILLVDFQTKDFQSSGAAGLQVFLGANPVPAPCTNAQDMVCGNHLKGTGMFGIATNSPTDTALAGKIVGGTFSGGPGNLSLQIALGGTQAITLDLLNARAKASAISDTGIMTANFGGALTQDDLNGKVIPAIQTQLAPIITRDCTMLTMPPDCGCMSGSTGKTLLGLFDGDITGTQKDCAVSVQEIQMNQIIKSLLAPDVCSQKSCSEPDALSLGIQVTTVKATWQ